MGDTRPDTVLGRMAAAGRQDRQARAMTLQKALRITIAKAADALMDLPLAMIGARIQSLAGDAVEGALDDAALLMLLDGPGRITGAAMLDAVLVGGLIQQQTLGTVKPDAGPARAMTRTDAAICAPLMDALMDRAAPILDEQEDRALIEGVRFGVKGEDARTVAMALDAQDYVLIRLTLDMARGARQGDLTLILPRPDPHAAQDPDTPTADAAMPGQDLASTVMAVNAELDMVLCTLDVPLRTFRGLKPGQVLALPPGQFPHVRIMTRTGRIVGKGIVGHVDGVRAVKPQPRPNHASQPLRRASDAPMVDMPQIEDIGAPGVTVASGEDRDGARLAEDRQLPAPAQEVAAMPSAETGLPDPEELPDLQSLPDLDDLPDLADLADLANLEISTAG